MRKYLTVTVALALLGSANAQTIYSNWAQWSGHVSNYSLSAQVMPVPLTDNILRDFRFAMAERPEPGIVGFSVQTVAAGVPTGVILFSDTAVWPVTNGVIKIENINLVLNPGEDYAFVVDTLGYQGESAAYTKVDVLPGHFVGWDYTHWNHHLQHDYRLYARFVADVPEPATALVFAVGLAALSVIRRSRRT